MRRRPAAASAGIVRAATPRRFPWNNPCKPGIKAVLEIAYRRLFMSMPESQIQRDSFPTKEAQAESSRAGFAALRQHVERQILGQAELVERLLIALLADGHLLVEGAQAAERESPPKVATPKAAKVLARVEQACRAGDAGSARRALLEWAALRWPADPPRRLEQVALRLGPEAVAALRDLDNHLYVDGTTSWDGTSAWRQLAPLLEARQRRGESGRRDTPLPPLYPQGA